MILYSKVLVLVLFEIWWVVYIVRLFGVRVLMKLGVGVYNRIY